VHQPTDHRKRHVDVEGVAVAAGAFDAFDFRHAPARQGYAQAPPADDRPGEPFRQNAQSEAKVEQTEMLDQQSLVASGAELQRAGIV
jgi:hypothetical protein